MSALTRTDMKSDTGSATLQTVIFMPLLVLVLLGMIHLGVWHQASTIAHAAAAAALTDARRADGSTASGTAAGQEVLNQNSTILRGSQISVRSSGETVTVTVTGSAASFLPSKVSHVSDSVSGPKERTTAP